MHVSRREFIERTGLALASLMMTRCTSVLRGDDPPTATPSARDRLRRCWLQFDRLTLEMQQDPRQGEETMHRLQTDHRAALDELVAAGALTFDVSQQVDMAFNAAVYHIWRSYAATCYEAVLLDYRPTSRGQLIQQAELLDEIAATGSLDQGVVARAQAVVERDIAFLSLSDGETEALYDALIKASDDTYDFPPFEDLDLEISPEAAEAARFLTELLLRSSE